MQRQAGTSVPRLVVHRQPGERVVTLKDIPEEIEQMIPLANDTLFDAFSQKDIFLGKLNEISTGLR